MEKYDFSGWATRHNVKCTDGRTITPDAFKHNDGKTVPLVYNHDHNDLENVIGNAVLQHRPEGVYAYCTLNDSKSGKLARVLVEHGDLTSLSIYANRLKQHGGSVLHGEIRELSLVQAGANPEAFIDTVVAHADGTDEEAVIYMGDEIEIYHADNGGKETVEDVINTMSEKQKKAMHLMIEKALEDKENNDDVEHPGEENEDDEEETVEDVINTMSEKQKKVMYLLIGKALEDKEDNDDEDSKGGNKRMKHNIFDKDYNNDTVLTHSDQEAILVRAKSNTCGSLQAALEEYCDEDVALSHGIDKIETLFPDYRDVRPGAPELITRDQGWVDTVMSKVHKSPISRIRTRQADVTDKNLRALGYVKGKEKKNGPNIKLLKRTTDPQTVYRKDALHRDDIVDITDFDVVEYQYGVMKMNLNEELALAFMVGDGREEGDEAKISEDHIRSVWHDDELYTIHTDVDFEAAKKELQGTSTDAHFGDNYIRAEAIISASLYSREKFKGSGTPDFYCTPHLLNVMLLARDRNGRRIYSSKSELEAALNVNSIHTAEQFEGKVRTDKENKKHKLLGIFVNMDDYHVGATKGGEITRFNQFDIDFNQEKYLIETRLSGALTRVRSAIALEEPVAGENSVHSDGETI